MERRLCFLVLTILWHRKRLLPGCCFSLPGEFVRLVWENQCRPCLTHPGAFYNLLFYLD